MKTQQEILNRLEKEKSERQENIEYYKKAIEEKNLVMTENYMEIIQEIQGNIKTLEWCLD